MEDYHVVTRGILALKRWLVASAALLAIVFFVRSPALLQSVESYVEALNLIVARELLSGHLPYTTAWESKPPLFFFILALFSLILGPTILTLRIASSLAIVAASLGIFRIGLLFPRDSKWIGWTAAILYVAMTCSDSGLAGEAEVFYAPFVIWGVALALEALMERRDVTRVSALGVGLLAGIAFQIKISAALEAAFILVLIAYACRSDARKMLFAAAGFAVPIIVGFVPYYFTGQTSFYFDANFWVFARRAHAPPPSHDSILGALREQLEAFFPVCVLVLPLPLLLRRADPQERQLLAWLAAWAIAGLVTALAIRELLGYQFIPVIAPASVIGAWALVTLANVRLRGTVVVSVLAIGVIAHTVGGSVRAVNTVYHRVALADPTYGDETARLGEFLSQHRGQGKWLYVVNDQPALYILTGAPPPTRFPFPPHLLDPEQEIVSGIDGTREVARILDARPVFVVFDGSYAYAVVRIGKANADRLRQNYALVYSVGGRGIYESLHPLSTPSSPALNP